MKFQSKTKIGIFIGAVVILLVIGVLFFCIAKPSTSDEIKTSYLRGTFSIDYSDLNAVVGDADYVFVGTVASVLFIKMLLRLKQTMERLVKFPAHTQIIL